MDNKTAAKVLEHLHASYEHVDLALVVIRDEATREEFEDFRRAAGIVLTKLYEGLLRPIYVEHVDLVPDGLRDAIQQLIESGPTK